jgi:hypothetical protein
MELKILMVSVLVLSWLVKRCFNVKNVLVIVLIGLSISLCL